MSRIDDLDMDPCDWFETINKLENFTGQKLRREENNLRREITCLHEDFEEFKKDRIFGMFEKKGERYYLKFISGGIFFYKREKKIGEWKNLQDLIEDLLNNYKEYNEKFFEFLCAIQCSGLSVKYQIDRIL